jgi:subtilisin family serine protease
MNHKPKKKLANVSFLMIAATAVVLVALFGSFDRAVSQDQQEFFYFYKGEKVPLTLSDEYVAIRPAETSILKSIPNTYPEIASVAPDKTGLPQSLTLVKLKKGIKPSEARNAYNKLRTDATIDLVAPAFKTRDGHMIVSDQFIVQFGAGVEQETIDSLNAANGVEVVEKVNWSENTFILRTQQGDALKMANQYAVTPGVIYSHPNFVRLMQRSPRMPQGSNGKMIFDKGGRLLPGDTVIPRGSSEYRVVENGSLKLPYPAARSNLRGYEEIAPDVPVNRSTIKMETFEAGFPNDWTLYGAPTWASTNSKAYEGTSSGYCVGSSVNPPGPYPNSADSWMVYGPFNLADATQAQLNLMAWVKTQVTYDKLWILASTDDYHYYGRSFSGDWQSVNTGSGGWMNISLDLNHVPGLGDLCGQSTVYIAIIFTSDSSTGSEGAYVDNIRLEKITGGYETLTSDEFCEYQWSLSNNGQSFGTSGVDIAVADAWTYSQGSDEPIIAIVDEGVDLGHPDLAGKLVTGYDATNQGSNGGPSGDDAHGTNCAGIAAAITDNTAGVAGIARNAKIMPIRIAYSGSDGHWVCEDAWIGDAFNWAVNNGAWVLSNSWGGGSPSEVIDNAVTNAKTNGRGGKGCLVAFAAGNDNSEVSYPGTLDNVLTVGALSPCNERKAPSSCDGEFWWGSNYGASLDIMAPGVHMYSTDISGAHGYDTSDYFYNFNGTSSATPVVSGVAGLILGTCPDITVAELETALRETAVDIGQAGVDQETGHGRVNAGAAIMAACGSSTNGALVIELGPAIAMGAAWRVDGGAWQVSGANVSLSAGAHSVEYKAVGGYTAPPSETVTITAGQTTTLNRSYTPVQTTGSLMVALGPSTAVGAQWRVDAGAWKNSGATVTGLNAGTHTVTFKALPGWKTPAGKTVTIVGGQKKTISAKYLPGLPVVVILAKDRSASEKPANQGVFMISRAGNPAKSLSVSLAISGSAKNGVDYRRIPATATIPAGKSFVNIVVKPIDDRLHEAKESVVITVKSSAAYKVGKQSRASVVIAASD